MPLIVGEEAVHTVEPSTVQPEREPESEERPQEPEGKRKKLVSVPFQISKHLLGINCTAALRTTYHFDFGNIMREAPIPTVLCKWISPIN